MKNPIFSIIIPVFNAEMYLAKTVESVIENRFRDFEVVIVDDGSQDSSMKIAIDLKELYSGYINVYQHENGVNKGVSTSRRLGVSKAQGRFIYFLDSDDILIPSTLERYKYIFDQNPDVDLIHGSILLTTNVPGGSQHEEYSRIYENDQVYNIGKEKYFLKKNRIFNSSVAVRRNVLLDIQFHFPQAFQVEDWVLWNLIGEVSKFYYSAEPSIQYRYHDQSYTFGVASRGDIYRKYAVLEMLYVTYSFATTEELRREVLKNIGATLDSLLKSYSGKQESLIAGLTSDITLKDRIESLIFENQNLKRNARMSNRVFRFLKRVFSR